MQPKINKKVIGIVGSLRTESFNKKLLLATQKLARETSDLDIEIFTLEAIPLFNQDEESNLPPAVVELKKKIEEADAVLIATPEYNYSVPGVLKNALDWASRPSGKSSFSHKPAAIIGASTSSLGSSRAVYHLRQILVALDMPTLNKPEIMVPSVRDKFADNGDLTDEFTKGKLKEFVTEFSNWINRFN